jgi:hypothetical protein
MKEKHERILWVETSKGFGKCQVVLIQKKRGLSTTNTEDKNQKDTSSSS